MESPTTLLEAAIEYLTRHDLLSTIWTSTAIITVAVIPIFTGAHAALSRPLTAAERSKKPESKARRKRESGNLKQGLKPSDALLLPIMCGCLLTGLYYLIKWLEDPALLNKILTIQQSVMGTFTIWQLVYDSQMLFYSLVFPAKYSHAGEVWIVADTGREFTATTGNDTKTITSPLPGRLSWIPLPKWVSRLIWSLREARTKPYAVLEIFAKDMGHVITDLYDSADLAAMVALTTAVYCNFVAKPWWVTNLYGFSACYSMLQLLSPTTFNTGSMLLAALFIYDIYFVFYTPIMLEVATKLDVPSAVLLIPEPAGLSKHTGKPRFSMIGLGDIILPGMMLCLALRFDLYMFYLRKQTQQSTGHKNATDTNLKDTKQQPNVVKVEYTKATGTWGERFWLDSQEVQKSGGYFPKPYFTAGMIGYVLGLIVTAIVLRVTKHGQPALLYLVPGVLGSLWGTAAIRGEIKHMWNYTEDETNEKAKKEETKNNNQGGSNDGQPESLSMTQSSASADSIQGATSSKSSHETSMTETPEEDRRLFYISITEPERWKSTSDSASTTEGPQDNIPITSQEPVDGGSESSFEVLSTGKADADAEIGTDHDGNKDKDRSESGDGDEDEDVSEGEDESSGPARKKQRHDRVRRMIPGR